MDDRLQKFARLVALGSFTAAAKDMHLSQPALTMAIGKLERELKTPLLIRGQRQLELTAAGRIVYAAAAEHRVVSENLQTRLLELSRKRPKVAIGMIDSVAVSLSGTPQPLDNLEAAADVSIVVNNSRYLRRAVESRELDLAFVVRDAGPYPKLDVNRAGAEPFMLVCRPERATATEAELEAGRLQHFISYDRQSTSYGHISRQLRKLGITARPTLYSTSPDVILRMVLRNRGVAALPHSLVRELQQAGDLVTLKKDGRTVVIECPISIIKPRDKILPEALGAFSHQAKTALFP